MSIGYQNYENIAANAAPHTRMKINRQGQLLTPA